MSMRFDITMGSGEGGDAAPTSKRNILFISNFSGSPSCAGKILPIDFDSLDTRLAGLAPTLNLDGSGTLNLTCLEDFHPDALIKNIPELARLADLRRRLKQPATFESARDELLGNTEASESADTDVATDKPAGDADFAELLGGTPAGSGGGQRRAQSTVDRLISNIVKESGEASATPDDASALINVVETQLAEALRSILHRPDFRSLESAWLEALALTEATDSEDGLRVCIADADTTWLSEALADPDADWLHKLRHFHEETETGNGWQLIIVDSVFGGSADELALLSRLGEFAASLNCPIIASADPALLGATLPTLGEARDWITPEPGLADAWQALRQSPQASAIGLALPAFIARQPYGRGSDEIETFPFTELPVKPEHQQFPWTNAGSAVARLIVKALNDEEPLEQDLDDLPLAIYDDGSGQAIKPCSGIAIPERTAEVICEAGLMPLVSFRNQNKVRVTQFRSIAEPAAPLAGIRL